MKRLLILAAAGVAAGVLLKRMATQQKPPWPGALHAPTTAGRADAPIGGDAGVLALLRLADRHVIAGATAALDRPLDETTEGLATMLRDEHRASLEQTEDLIAMLAIEPSADRGVSQLDRHRRAGRDALQAVDDDDFDEVFVQTVIDEHESLIALIDERLLPVCSDGRVRARAVELRGHLESHLRDAAMLAGDAPLPSTGS